MTTKQVKPSQAQPIEKVCKRVKCGKTFTTLKPSKEYCKDSCRIAEWKERHLVSVSSGAVILRYAGPGERFAEAKERIVRAVLAASQAGEWTVENPQ